MSNSPFYDLVPKDAVENLRWRIRCRERAMIDKRFRDALWQACMSDLCFFMAFACFGYDPRARFKVVPFIPYPHQEKVFVAMDEAINTAEREERSVDVVLDKARAQGGTFGYLWVDLRRWLRDPMFSAGYVTRNEDLIDSKSDSSTVLWKIAWAIEKLPVWMIPSFERHLGHHTFINNDNGSLLRGYSAGQDVAAGGRATVFTVDEAGARDFVAGQKDEAVQESIQDVTNCLSSGVLVVTNDGLIPIEDVSLHHQVWDGRTWVSHEGCVYQGEQKTIQSYGIELTPDHRVLTKNGWKHARDLGFDREDISLPDGYRDEWPHEVWQDNLALPMQVRQADSGFRGPAQSWSHEELRLLKAGTCQETDDYSRNGKNAYVECLVVHGSALHQPEESCLSELRRSGHQCLRALVEVRELSGGHGRKTKRTEHRQERQQSGILPRELQMGNRWRASQQQEILLSDTDIEGHVQCCAASKANRGKPQHDQRPHQERLDRGCSFASTQNPKAVYDLLNCGPRMAFTVIDGSGRPLLVHNCVRLVSARYVDSGVFHNACENPDTAKSGVHLVLDWKDHPLQSKHSYIVREGIAVAINPNDQAEVSKYHKSTPDLRARLERKGFKYEGVIRSPWYDMRCLRPTSTPRLIASQLDRNPKGAVGKVFSSDLLDRMKRTHCQGPVWVGNPVFDSETCKLTGLIPREDGALKLWFKPGIDNSPPLGPFTAGCDIASGGVGAYSSNSVITALDDRTGEQVLEYTIKGLEPRPFARRVVGICMWLRNALLGWEDSGVSGGFAKEIMEVIYYGNVFFRDVTQLGSQKKSRKPGWPCRDADKADMFEMMALAMENGKFVPRSEEMITECGEYEWDGTKIVHAPSKNKGASDKNHADRCLIAGTMVLTDKGEVPIEDLSIGDLVWTRKGLRPVILSGLTGIENVFRVTLSNGRVLNGTGNHPVWTENRSWVQLQSLRQDDILLPCQIQKQKQSVDEFTSAHLTPKRLCSMVESTIVAQIRSDDTFGCIFGADQSTEMDLQSHCTLLFGRITTDLCQMAVSFITRMRTLSTMTFPISNALLGLSTERFTITGSILGVHQFSMPISASIAGKSTKAFGNARLSFAVKHAARITSKREHALFVTQSLRLKQDEQHEPVLRSAQNFPELGSSTTLASTAVSNSNQTARHSQRSAYAARNVEGVCVLKIEKLRSPQKVYNLSVADTPEYFANGVLVHNCISAAGAWLVYNTDNVVDKLDTSDEIGQTPEYGSFLWREQQERRGVARGSPQYGIRDVIGH